MRKPAKRKPPVAARAKRKQVQLSARAGHAAVAPPAASSRAGAAIDGHVLAVESGFIRAVLAQGESVEALCPAHIDSAWLKEACARAPVPAVFFVTQPSARYVLWGLFPGSAHADVRCDVVIQGRQVQVNAESLHLRSENANLRLDAEGNVTLKGRDITSHARRVNRVKGGSIRLN